MTGPPGKRTGPEDTTPQARPNVESPPRETDKATVTRARCKFLRPRHLTGCRQPVEPGSVYCAQHGGAT
jgi:hypothetical protein